MLNHNIMFKMLNTKSDIITRQNRFVYNSPAHIPHIELCNIFGSSKVTIRTMPTSFTFNKSTMPDSFSVMTNTASLRGISRVDINNSNSFSQCFIFNKTLELPESPLVNPFIVFSCCSNSFKVFHDDYIAIIQSFDNITADIVVAPLHQPSPAPTQLLKLSLGSSCAFTLENRNKFIMLNPQLLNILAIKSAIRSYCNFIDTEVNAQNSFMLVRILDIFPSECKSKIIFFFVLSQKTFNNLPIKILQGIIRNLNRNFNSALNSRNGENIIFEAKTSRDIVSNRSFF